MRRSPRSLSPSFPLALFPLALLALPALLLSVLLPAPARADESGPVLFPSTAAGWVGRMMDPRDTAPYLAFHKAAMAERSERIASLARGRTTPNQLAYDALFYDLDLNLDPVAHVLTGNVLTRARVLSGPLATFDLDLAANMTVTGSQAGGHAATFSHIGDVLTVTLDRAYQTGETVEVRVLYNGNPQGDAWGWDTHLGQPMIWTLSEPFGGRTWWPSKDWSDDKADSVNVRVTAPTGLITASNGELREQSDNGITSVARWHEGFPISTYLVSLAVHPFAVYSDWYHASPSDSLEIKFFMYPDDVQENAAVNAKVKDMIGIYSGIFGAYPFQGEKYGHAEFPWGGGMEHQTCTSLGYFGEWVVAHELAHQWWGDMITCEDFHHVWLNEGFATYCEALYSEVAYGPDGYRQDIDGNKYFGPGSIYVPDLNDWGRIFDSNLSYNKGSWVLHMLRHVLGEEDFFASLRAYYQTYRYSVATTEKFRDVCEQVSGRDLDWFFQEWIYGEYYPEYSLSYTFTPGGGGWDVALTIDQTQTWQIFRMPVDVTIHMANGEQTFVVENSLATQDYLFHVTDEPRSVRIDEGDWILKTVTEPIYDPPFDRGVLLVNAVDWTSYGDEIASAYQDRAFTGDYVIDFWDLFPEPAGGYPSTLPDPIGSGAIPPDVLGRYRNVVWVASNYNGDLGSWRSTPIVPYLEAGGNVLLLTRMGQDYLTEQERAYLGITWESGSTIYDCIASYPGLTNIVRLGTQNYCSLFNLTLSQPDSRVIYQAQQYINPDRGIGVWRKPAGGGMYRPDGAQFVFLSGRPYRWEHASLRQNMVHVLETFFEEPIDPAGTEEAEALPRTLTFSPARPNPASGAMQLSFALPRAGSVELTIVDVSGRLVRELLDQPLAAGSHAIRWDGKDGLGHDVPAGVYWSRLQADGERRVRRLVVVR
ncbi:MAG: M1 family aminopeptidase [Candidatus Eisenbacteria bacterium]|nr:M1 family aminopeptidase [Candidatus Eisenbacteria bacterium]